MTLDEKFGKLKDGLRAMQRVIIAYSGGVDSTFLLKAASLSGMEKILAVTAYSESFPRKELEFSKKMASAINIKHKIIETEELKDVNYAINPPDRCYYCKKELFGKLRSIAEESNFRFILDGTNTDDKDDWRPGGRAALENGVQSPLLEAGFSKQDIRDISRALGLPTWNKPATPCLSSRFPYGQRITAGALERVELAEEFMEGLGFREFRVRDHSETAKIEVLPDDFQILMDGKIRSQIVTYLKSLGYLYVTLDMQGFRSGSLNKAAQVVQSSLNR